MRWKPAALSSNSPLEPTLPRMPLIRCAGPRSSASLRFLGGALFRAEEAAPELMERLPELRRIIGMRNRIIHGYDAVDDEIVWDAVQRKIPLLLEQISTLFRSEGENV
jgi:uncharacterized protein with HEPN domain